MKTIYQICPRTAYFTGISKEISVDAGTPLFWVEDAPPVLNQGDYARWNNPSWVVTHVPPPVEREPDIYVEDTLQQAPKII